MYLLEQVNKWLGAVLNTVPKVQLWGKAAEEADTPILVDSDGHLQVDALSTALPTDAATETTLEAIKTAVEILDNIVSGNEAQVDIVGSLPAGSATIGNVVIGPATSGGLSIFRSIDLDESEEEIKGSAGMVYGMILRVNLVSTSIRYIKFYDGTAASVVVGTTTPVMTIPVSGSDTKFFSIPQGIVFSNGITVAATTGLADNDTGAPAANVVIVNVFYK